MFNSDNIIAGMQGKTVKGKRRLRETAVDRIFSDVMTQLDMHNNDKGYNSSTSSGSGSKKKKRKREEKMQLQFFGSDNDSDDYRGNRRNDKRRTLITTTARGGGGGDGYLSDESDIIDDLSEMMQRQRQGRHGDGLAMVDDVVDLEGEALELAMDLNDPVLVDDAFIRDMEAAEEMPEDRMLRYLEDKLGITRHKQRMRERRGNTSEDDNIATAAGRGGGSELQRYVEEKRRKRLMERERQQGSGKTSAQQGSEEEKYDDDDDLELDPDDIHSDAPSYEVTGDGLDDLLADLEKMERGEFSEDSEDDFQDDMEYEMDDDGSQDDEDDDLDESIPNNSSALPALTPTSSVGKYIPPRLRRQAQEADQSYPQSMKDKLFSNRSNEPVYQALLKKVKSCINKLSESNMASLVQEALAIYGSNSKNDFHEIMTETILNAICDSVNLMSQFVLVYAGFVVALHNIGAMEIGAFFIEKLVQRFDSHRIAGDRQKATNLLWMLCHLYNLRMVYSGLMFDLVKVLALSLDEKPSTDNQQISELDIDLLLKLIRTSGFQLRSDDPAKLKDAIVDVQTGVQRVRSQIAKKGNSGDEPQHIGNRLTFMLDTLNDLKLNKQRRGTQDEIDKVNKILALLRRIQKISGKTGDFTLRIPYQDALLSNKKGRWWLVGSAWAGNQHKPDMDSENMTASARSNVMQQDSEEEDEDSIQHVMRSIKSKEMSQLENLAREQRMNTDLRRSIFYILMSSEDCIDASQQLAKLGLVKHDREIVRVLMHCCSQEKTFNPYYYVLSAKLCAMERRIVRTFQFVFYEHFKQLASYPVRKVINLSHLLSFMLLSEVLHLSILKVVDFTDLSSMELVFFRLLFLRLLLTDGSDAELQRSNHEGEFNDCEKGELKAAAIFMRMVRNPTCESLKDGLTLFLFQFRKKQFRRQFSFDLLSVMNVNKRHDRKWLKSQDKLLKKRAKKADKVMRLVATEREEELLDADERELDNDDRTLFTDY